MDCLVGGTHTPEEPVAEADAQAALDAHVASLQASGYVVRRVQVVLDSADDTAVIEMGRAT